MIRSRRRIVLAIITLLPWLAAAVPAAAQKVETLDGVRVVHNTKGGLWGDSPRLALELVRKIGDIDTDDERLAFHYPSDVAMDAAGHIYILDTGNTRIQKFGPDGVYLTTIGRKGQGPGEFIMPDGLDIDRDGNLVAADPEQGRIQIIVAGGRDVRSVVLKDERIYGIRSLGSGGFAGRASTYALPGRDKPGRKAGEMRLFRTMAPDGRITGSFGILTDFGDPMTNAMGNESELAVDARDNLFVSFNAQNRIEKYGPDGKLLWRADRPLSYGTEVRKKGRSRPKGGGISMSAPEMNACSKGVAVDGQGRAWVLTYARQIRKDEEVATSMTAVSAPGGLSVSIATKGNTDVRKTDAFKLDDLHGRRRPPRQHPAHALRRRPSHLRGQFIPHRPRARRHGLPVSDHGEMKIAPRRPS